MQKRCPLSGVARRLTSNNCRSEQNFVGFDALGIGLINFPNGRCTEQLVLMELDILLATTC